MTKARVVPESTRVQDGEEGDSSEGGSGSQPVWGAEQGHTQGKWLTADEISLDIGPRCLVGLGGPTWAGSWR